MLTILTALPWEAGAFSQRLCHPCRVELGDGWATWGERNGMRVRIVVSGPGVERAAAAGAALASLDPPASKLLAVGVAGGMRAGLASGTVVLAEAFQHERQDGQGIGERLHPDKGLTALGVAALEQARVQWTYGKNLTVAVPLLRAEEKHDRSVRSRASVVQMEDYLWAEAADALRLPFASLRVVLDPVEADLPSAVASWDWRGPSVSEIARSLLRQPRLALALPRLAWHRRAARHTIDAVLEVLVDTPCQGAHA